MRIRKTMMTGLALAATLLLVLSGCYFDINLWDPDPEPDPEADPLFSFSLEWTDIGSENPHIYMTYPAPLDGDTTDGNDLVTPIDNTPTFTEPYTPIVVMAGGDIGFLPEDIVAGPPSEGVDERGTVYYGNLDSQMTYLGDPAVELTDINDESEVIALRGFPFTSSSTTESTAGGGLTGLDIGSYTWVGVMEVYAFASSGQLAYASGSGVDAILNVYRYGELFASYELPANTDLAGASIVRINCFYEGDTEIYQFVPDVRVIQDTVQIRSVAPGSSVDAQGVITFRNPAGE